MTLRPCEQRRAGDEATGRQIGIALRFLDRLVALPPAQRLTVRVADEADTYLEAVAWVRAALRGADKGRGLEHPTGGREAFAERMDRHLDEAGIVDALWMFAREAVRAILVWDQSEAQHSCRLVYQPFEAVIPLASLE
jgi:hypothetical protein